MSNFIQPLIASLSDCELSARWQKSPRYLFELRKAGKMPTYFKVGSSIRYLLTEIEKFEANNSAQ